MINRTMLLLYCIVHVVTLGECIKTPSNCCATALASFSNGAGTTSMKLLHRSFMFSSCAKYIVKILNLEYCDIV